MKAAISLLLAAAAIGVGIAIAHGQQTITTDCNVSYTSCTTSGGGGY